MTLLGRPASAQSNLDRRRRRATTFALGEEGAGYPRPPRSYPYPTTRRWGETGRATTFAHGEEGGATTFAWSEEGSDDFCAPVSEGGRLCRAEGLLPSRPEGEVLAIRPGRNRRILWGRYSMGFWIEEGRTGRSKEEGRKKKSETAIFVKVAVYMILAKVDGSGVPEELTIVKNWQKVHYQKNNGKWLSDESGKYDIVHGMNVTKARDGTITIERKTKAGNDYLVENLNPRPGNDKKGERSSHHGN